MKNEKELNESLTDFNGNIYKTIQIGNQIWMAENLNVRNFCNGDPILKVSSTKEWEKAGKKGIPAWCYYDYNDINGNIYGAIYNYYAIIDDRGICPKGWVIPQREEINRLFKQISNNKIYSSFTQVVKSNLNASLCGNYNGDFEGINKYGCFWSLGATMDNLNGHCIEVNSEKNDVSVSNIIIDSEWGFYVRCIKRSHDLLQIGTQLWMAENLNVNCFRNGDIIQEAKTKNEWINASEKGMPAWCYYLNNYDNANKYGKLYNWYALNDKRGLCPDGYRIPKVKDFAILYRELKTIQNYNDLLLLLFRIYPTGSRYPDGTFCDKKRRFAGFWCIPKYNVIHYIFNNRKACGLFFDFEIYHGRGKIEKLKIPEGHFGLRISHQMGLSIRCLKIN